MLQNILILVFVLLFVGCKSDPYSDVQTTGAEQKLVPEDQAGVNADASELEGTISISAEPDHTINEGALHAIPINYDTSEGNAIIEFENLDTLPGAYYDEEKRKVYWEPDFQAANDLLDPTVKSRYYNFNVVVSSTLKPNVKNVQTISVKVLDTRRAFTINYKTDKSNNLKKGIELSVAEGAVSNNNFTIKDLDFPDGPFEIYTDSLRFPSKVIADPDNSNRFNFQLEPGFEALKVNSEECKGMGSHSNSRCSIDLDTILYVRAPDGSITQRSLKIKLRDSRKDPIIVLPKEIHQAGEVSFNVEAVDPNGEVAPVITLETRDVQHGAKPIVEEIPQPNIKGSFRSSVSVRWTDIAPVFVGKSEFLEFKVCVKNTYSSMNNCSSQHVKVVFEERKRSAPIISRENWEFFDKVYIKEGNSKRVYLPIKATDDDDHIVSVHILCNGGENCDFTYRSNYLTVKPEKTGMQYFSVTAVSRYGMMTTENFIFEGLPTSWEKNLYVGESQNDKELKFLQRAESSVKIVNPAIMDLDTRLYTERQRLVAGTNLLKDKKLAGVLVDMIKPIKDIVIMSPLLNNIPSEILEELKKYDVVPYRRLSEVSGASSLEKLKLLPIPAITELATPVGEVKLAGATNEFAHDPMQIFVGPLADGTCKELLILRGPQITESYTVGVQCKRENGGTITLLGFEPQDIIASGADLDIGLNWLKAMMKGQL